MGFRNKLKNIFDNKKEDAPQSFSPETDKDDPTGRLSGNETSDEAGSAELSNTLCFRYLYHLIKMGRTNIVLHKDIVLRDDEPAEPFHITEDMVIDGNGHSIDARGKTSIFHITKGDFTLKNITLKNGFGQDGGAIFHDGNGELAITDCELSGNEASNSGGAIFARNRGSHISRTVFSNNVSGGEGSLGGGAAIFAEGDVRISDCRIIGNESESIISSSRDFQIYDCVFKANRSGKLINSFTYEHDGLLGGKVFKGVFDIRDCRFEGNVSESMIFNAGESCTLARTVFENNDSSLAIENSAVLNISGFEMRDSNPKISNGGSVRIMGGFSDSNQITGSGSVESVELSDSFQYLDSLIHSGVKVITLDSDIMAQHDEREFYAWGINLDVEGLTIDGGGHEINANAFARIFNVTADGVTLKNIRFIRPKGTAIHNSGSLRIENCTLSNNKVNCETLIENEGNLDISDSTFSNNRCEVIHNKATLSVARSVFSNSEFIRASAISNHGVLHIEESDFAQNSVKVREGIVFNDSDATLDVVMCRFSDNFTVEGNSFLNDRAVAIFNRGVLSVESSSFISNAVNENSGGIISNEGDLTVRTSVFKSNEMAVGGAIYLHLNRFATINLYGCRFVSNKSMGYAAAINGSTYADYYDFNIYDCEFFKNVSKDTGVIAVHSGALKIINCKFTKNRGRKYIIKNNDFLQIYNSTFEKNKAPNIITNLSKSMYSNGLLCNFSIFNAKFLNNKVKDAVIYNEAEICLIYGTRFEGNLKRDVGNIINNRHYMTLNGVKSTETGQIILNEGRLVIEGSDADIEGKVYGSGVVEENAANDSYGQFDFTYLDEKIHEDAGMCEGEKTIVLEEDITLQDYEKDFYEGGIVIDVDGLVIDGKGHSIDAADKSRIFLITADKVTLKNITFKNGLSFKHPYNRCNGHGGALKVNSKANLKIIDCEFIENRSQDHGGAIYNRGDLTLCGSQLADNASEGIYNIGDLNVEKSRLSGNSVGIVNMANLSISDCVISGHEKNSVINKGRIRMEKCSLSGGQMIDNAGDFQIENSTFCDNSGSIFNKGALNIFNSTFSDNKNGAIKNRGELTVGGCSFNANSSKDGGAIKNSGRLTVDGCSFNANASDDGNGGAIFNKDIMVIDKSSFELNTSGKKGSAIYNSGDVKIARSKLSDNFSAQTVYNLGIIHLDDCDLSGNDLGEMYNEKGIMNLTDSRVSGDSIAVYNARGLLNLYNSPINCENDDGTLIIDNKFKKSVSKK